MRDKRMMVIVKNYCKKCDISKKTVVCDEYVDEFRLAIKSLIEEKLGFDESVDESVGISKYILKERGFSKVLDMFDDDLYKMLDFIYPNKFKPWQIKKIQNKYWEEEEIRIQAIKWLVEEKLGIAKKSPRKVITKKMFADNGLGGLLKLYYDNSPNKAIKSVYSKDYKAWELGRAPNGFWKDEQNRIDALNWLFKDKLNLSYDDIERISMRRALTENGLGGLAKAFNNQLNEIREYIVLNKVLG